MDPVKEIIADYIKKKYESYNLGFTADRLGFSIHNKGFNFYDRLGFYVVPKLTDDCDFLINPAEQFFQRCFTFTKWPNSFLINSGDPELFNKLDVYIADVCEKFKNWVKLYNHVKHEDISFNLTPFYVRYRKNLIYFIETKTHTKNRNRLYLQITEPNILKIFLEFVNRTK